MGGREGVPSNGNVDTATVWLAVTGHELDVIAGSSWRSLPAELGSVVTIFPSRSAAVAVVREQVVRSQRVGHVLSAELARSMVDGSSAGAAVTDAATFNGWTTAERLRFLNRLPRNLRPDQLSELDRRLSLNSAGNNEVLFAWLNLALDNRYQPAVEPAERFLAAMGRRKFVLPLFQTLWGEGEWGQAIARRVYQRVRPTYHAVTSGSVDRVVGR